jgi:hypothetical protein
MSDGRTYEDLRYPFTPDELRDLGLQLAAREQDRIDAEAEKKSTNATFNARIGDLDKEIAELTRKVNTGYEMRPVEVFALFDTPVIGTKRIVRADKAAGDPEATLREEPMTLHERQSSFGFNFDPEDRDTKR